MVHAHACASPLRLFRMQYIIVLKLTLAYMYVSSEYASAGAVLPPQLELGATYVLDKKQKILFYGIIDN